MRIQGAYQSTPVIERGQFYGLRTDTSAWAAHLRRVLSRWIPSPVPQARGTITRAELAGMYAAQPGETERLEADVVEALGVDYAVAQPSARVAIVRALGGLGVCPGDEVLVSAFNYPPLIALFRREGWVPVFVDVASGSLAACPDAVAAAVGPRTRALVATHAFGRPAPMRAYRTLADRHRLVLVEDAAQAMGSRVGRWGDATVYSFGPTKPLHAWGGAVLTTASLRLAERLRGAPDTRR
ncbi:MAG: DegT/DnrJ/EryC1/StrS family aminotransferase, partial [Sandaracinaceae bacterium]